MNQPILPSSKLSRLARAWWWTTAPAALAIALLTIAAGAASREAGAASCPGQFTIDFAGLPAGTIIGEQYADFGVHISGVANEGFPDALIVFDTNAPPTHDPDLAVDIGNIAIFAENLTDVKPPPNGDGLVDDPDENNFGGTATFAFDQEVSIGSFLFIDKDHANPNFAVAYNAAGDVLVSVPVPQGANGSVQRVAINADGVRRLEFVYHESGGFTGIEVACEQATATPTATAAPTATPTAPPTATPTPLAETPTPTQAPSPTPTAAAATASPVPTPTAVADTSVQQTPVALGADNLPAGGGSPGSESRFSWAAALLGVLVVAGGSLVWMQNARR